MKRVAEAIGIVVIFILLANIVHCKEKKIKVYLDVQDVAYSESFALYLQEHLRPYNVEWVGWAPKAEYIISILVNKNPLPVMYREDGRLNMCYQFVATIHLWRKGSGKTYEMLNQQLDCDPNEIAKRAVEALVTTMLLKPSEVLTKN